MRVPVLLRFLTLVFVLVIMCIFISNYTSFSMKTLHPHRWIHIRTIMGTHISQIQLLQSVATKEKPFVKNKCGLLNSCAANFFAFKMNSGAANVVGPSLCFEDELIMSPVKDNVGRGLNIALLNGTTGKMLKHDCFDMYSGDPTLLVKFLKEIPAGVLVLVASYDDPGSKMNDEIRELFSKLGSKYAKQIGFRDSWVFVGARDIKDKSPYEQYLKNHPDFNKYEGWPEMLELEGCLPRKVL